MILIPGAGTASAVKRQETFTGEVWSQALLAPQDDVTMGAVCFQPGARSHWHMHEKGQMITVVSGSGIIASRDGQVLHVRAGDMVWTAPGVEHWHGAGPDSMLVHQAFSLGATEWRGPVDDEEYESASRLGRS